MTGKEELRALIQKNRSAISMIEVVELSARIAERVLALPDYARAERVLLYASIQTEVDTRALIREILRSGRKAYLPRTYAYGVMEAARLIDPELVRRTRLGIYEPVGDEIGSPESMDLILVPGIAFDRRGGRLGRGAGYYDRYLANCEGTVAALAFELQILDALPVEAHDVLMDMVITERTIYDCHARS